jgi:hypothetical protein
MVDKKTILSISLVCVLLITNGFWFVNNQQLQSENEELQETNAELLVQYQELSDQKDELEEVNSLLENQYSALATQYSILFDDLNNSEKEKSELQENYSALNIEFQLILGQYEMLLVNYSQLQNEFSELTSNYSTVNSDYLELLADYDRLLSRYQELEEVCDLFIGIYDYNVLTRLDSLANDYYETIRSEKLNLFTDKCLFYSRLSRHDRGAYIWSDLDAIYYEKTYTSQSPTNLHRYDEAMDVLIQVISIIGINDTQTPVEKIKLILDFIDRKIVYNHDMSDEPFAPTETLSSGTGDCEDFSILASCLFEIVGIQSAVARFTDGDSGHVMVLVHLSNLGGYGHYYYSDLTNFGLSSGEWIIIEPQNTIAWQDDASWIPQWEITDAVET